jgi:hypothetical protein
MGLLDGDGGGEVRSLTKAGVVLAVYLFIVLLVYFALSGPVNALFNAFDSTNWGAAESQHASYMSLIRQAMTVFFAIFISIPIVWFFFWVFHREPAYIEYNQERRY